MCARRGKEDLLTRLCALFVCMRVFVCVCVCVCVCVSTLDKCLLFVFLCLLVSNINGVGLVFL